MNPMSSPSERSSSNASPEFVFRLPRRALTIAGIAFAVGLLLFLVIWWAGRDQRFYTAQPAATGPQDSIVEALPEPMPAGEGASGMEEPRTPQPDERPQLVETAPPPPPVAEPVAPVAPQAPAAPSVTLAPGASPVPISGQSPPPTYPASAMRRGERGTVLLRVDVGVDGVPSKVSIEHRSGSRALDRAAVDAVRQWRFHPAQRDGQPVPASLVVPIDFNVR